MSRASRRRVSHSNCGCDDCPDNATVVMFSGNTDMPKPPTFGGNTYYSDGTVAYSTPESAFYSPTGATATGGVFGPPTTITQPSVAQDVTAALPGIASILGTVEGINQVNAQRSFQQQMASRYPVTAPVQAGLGISPTMLLMLGALALVMVATSGGSPHRR